MTEVKLIAEIGWNHMGSLILAEKMIKAAKASGADFAKFQTWRVKNLKHGPWDSDGRREIYEKAELGKEDYSKISKICKKYKIKFLTSLFNHDDYQLIQHLRPTSIKIPSPENRNKELLKFVSKKFKNIFLSTGAAKINEIKKSLKYLHNNNVTVMHCVSSYPCIDENADLSRILRLKEISKNIGLSDHTSDILSSTFSLNLGVTLIEKHFTIDNNLPGRDNKFAILPNQFLELKKNITRFHKMFKKKQEVFISQEKEIRNIYTGRWSKSKI
jgi:N,N'-diacetyllegionaminate synthase|tara:strand:- start:1351 stop:2166 length:816 start_codon:yes stop_codon:yes gene_type:complete